MTVYLYTCNKNFQTIGSIGFDLNGVQAKVEYLFASSGPNLV